MIKDMQQGQKTIFVFPILIQIISANHKQIEDFIVSTHKNP